MRLKERSITVAAATLSALMLHVGAAAQELPSGLANLTFAPLHFDQPTPERHEVAGVPILLLEDRDLPLVTALVGFKGGYGLFPRSDYAAATALPALLRYGGTRSMAPDSVDTEIDTYAMQLSFGSGGGAISSSMNVLSEHFSRAMHIWGGMITEPGFDSVEVAAWRGRQAENVLRRPDDPSTLAFSEFNRLLYGDHPIGWEMTEADLSPEVMNRATLEAVHRRIVCRDNLILGLTGDLSWSEVHDVVEEFVSSVPPCEGPLPEAPVPDVDAKPGVFLMHKDLEQAVVVLAHPTDLPLADDPEYFSSTIGNTILGAGGFSSRLMARVRTEEGYAYSASSLWTTPRRYPGLLGAVTRTRPETAVPAIELILETMNELARVPPLREEVETTVNRIVNGFVFNFETAAQIVSRSMYYMAQDLPADWLERYLRGVQNVSAREVSQVFSGHLRPEEMTIFVLGDTARVGLDRIERLGAITVLPAP
jgi:predicted Zn-dependent peptidase